jgi:uncharacterized protein
MQQEEINQDSGLTVRQPELSFGPEIARYWFCDNPTITHNFNGYNLMFPTFERFFIRSVLYYKDRITDPQLKAQVAAFVSQEANHARAHEDYFALLEQQGYPVRRHLKRFDRYTGTIERLASPKLRIAMTAAAEHYTATLANIILHTPSLVERMAPEMQKLIVWHAVEEMEHRSVAFNVMRQAEVGYLVRILAFLMVTLDSLLWVNLGSFLFLRTDRISLFRSLRYKLRFRREFPAVSGLFRRSLLAYFRRGYHPDQMQTPAAYHSQLDNVGIHATS